MALKGHHHKRRGNRDTLIRLAHQGEPLSQPETAIVLGISRQAVQDGERRALQKLREVLSDMEQPDGTIAV